MEKKGTYLPLSENEKNGTDTQFPHLGYLVSIDGTITSAAGRSLNVSDTGYVWVVINGKKRRKQAGRFVYEAVTGKHLGAGYVLLFKDGNCCNIAFDNLDPVKRKEYFEGFDWQALKKISAEQQDEIIKAAKQGVQSKILAKQYHCCEQTITKIINGKY